MTSDNIRLAETATDTQRCFPVMAQLRPHLKADEFVNTINRLRRDGYQLAFIERGENVVAVAGYRFRENLFLGKFMYVDDLVTDNAQRSSGYGKQLFTWLRKQALDKGCSHLELDSGVQRFDAHRFYLRERMDIRGHHFSLEFKNTI